MEVYKLGKVNLEPGDWYTLCCRQLGGSQRRIEKILEKKEGIAIAENDTHYKEIDTTKVFSNGYTQNFDVAIVDLVEKNRAQVEEIRSLKIEQESQAMMLCEITE